MAGADKLWFEMGVKNETIKEFERTKKEALETGKVIGGITKELDYYRDNINKVKNAYYQLNTASSKLSSAMSVSKDPAEIKKMQEAISMIEKYRAELQKLEADKTRMMSKGAVSGFMNDNSFSLLQKTTNQYTKSVLQGVNASLRSEAQAANQASAANSRLVSAFDRVTEAGHRQNAMVGQLRNQLAMYFSIYGAENFLKSIIQVGGQFEVQHIALQSILGDAQNANTIFAQIKDLAVVSPFTFRDLTSYAKQLSAFSIPYNELFDTTKRLADISAGLGVDMSRLILAYGQVRSASVLRGQELRLTCSLNILAA